MDLRGRPRWVARSASQRLRDAWWPIILASVAAALSWFVAHTVAIGKALVALLGPSTVALGVIVLVTMGAAVAAGVGFFGEGMMFANQAAASAILVVTLHRHGSGGERVIDAIVGGAIAFVLGVVLFPAEPLSMLRDRQLDVPARAQSTAHANVRIAPRRWRLRAAVDAESGRTTQLDLLANAVLGTVRSAATGIQGTTPITRELASQITALADAVERLAGTPGPWPEDLGAEVQRLVRRTLDHPAAPPGERDAVTAAIVRAAADDLERLVVGGAAEWTAPGDGRAWHG